MIDSTLLRDQPDRIIASLNKRGASIDILNECIALDKSWRNQQQALEDVQAKRNSAIPKGAPSLEQRAALSELSKQVKTLQETVNETKSKLDSIKLQIPNIIQDDVPEGASESDNIVIREYASHNIMDFSPKSHDELAVNLGLVDFERSAKISGSRFATFIGQGAQLERAIANFMLDAHRDLGYIEVSPPVLINTTALTGTGQLPKFSDDCFDVSDDLWLSPTAEVQLTNLHQNEILNESDLPIKYCAFTQCFRKEAGSYGKDMKGLIRLHEFNKVELVQITHPDESDQRCLELLSHAESILQRLELPYRVVLLCSGDTGFSSSKTYDIEVWLPSQNAYREISSCSNFLNFQSNRAKIRFKDANKKVHHAHTINGSGLAVGRTFAAILENYQDESGIIKIPKELRHYMNGKKIIQ